MITRSLTYKLADRWLLLGISFLIILTLFFSGCGSATKTAILPSTTTRPASPMPSSTPQAVTLTATVPPQSTPTDTTTPLPTPTETSLPIPSATPTEFPEQIEDKYGVLMVLVPAGPFIMGSNDDQAEAKPAHEVYLDTYYIDQYEVTNAMYLVCVEAGICTTGGSTRLKNPVFADHPVMNVDWWAAQKFCEWRGGSLPTEAQWEKAARGTDGRRYPWGNEPVTCERARYGDCGWFTVPVGQHPTGVSPYGAHDMAGNAWEWVYDWYDADYYLYSPDENPTGPAESTGWKSERGGAWFYMADLMSSVWRNQAPDTASYAYVGFRCARTP